MNLISTVVTRRTDEAVGIVGLDFREASGAPLPAFTAGSHIDVHVRPYSLCFDPVETDRYSIAVLREPLSRGGSAAVHELLHVGAAVRVSAPKNNFPLAAKRPAILFAGGIGVTPLLSMAWHLARERTPFTLHYCARSKDRAAFQASLASGPLAAGVRFHFGDGEPSQKLQLGQVLAEAGQECHLYVCGPPGFIDHVLDGARAAGWTQERLHVEYFSNAALVPKPAQGDRPFAVRIASTGQTLEIPSGEPVTSILARNGIEVPLACEQGICGTCVTRVLEGEPDHRDMYFTEEERARNDQFTPCCSRARGPLLVLDL